MLDFFTNPFNIALYSLFAAAVLALWWRPKISIVLGFAAAGLAFYLNYISNLGATWLVIIALMAFAYPLYQRPTWVKFIHGLGIFAGCFLFYLHLMPGVYNPIMLDSVRLGTDSWPYRSYLNVDKIFLSVALLAVCVQLNKSKQDWVASFRSVVGPFLLLAVVLAGLGLTLGFVRLDVKIPTILWLWLPTNLLFVCVADQALFRGFLQKELSVWLKNVQGGHWLAIGVAALAYGGLHFYGGPVYMLLSTIAGGVYGYAYYKSGRLESAIAVQFLINLTHFFFFSYPALR